MCRDSSCWNARRPALVYRSARHTLSTGRCRSFSREAVELERRHLTVMFCDLADSTALSTQLDPEELASLLGNYQSCCREALAPFDVTIARWELDGFLVYSGYPQEHEDSAERAIRAGFAVIQDLSLLGQVLRARLQVRIGIATGPVVVGDLPGRGETNAVVGETPNLASRLQQLAEPNTVVIAESTYRLARGLFDCVELAPVKLKGFASPVKAWRVAKKPSVVGRFDARRAAGLTRYHGRATELDALTECWRASQAVAGRVAFIRGEAGLGKSRLAKELSDRLASVPHRQLVWIGSAFFQNSPLSPIIAQLERAAGFSHDDSPQLKREKLDMLLISEGDKYGAAGPLLASLLSLPSKPQDPDPDPDPKRRKRQTFDMIVNWIADLATREPVLLVCEDAHWFDHTTLELLDILVERIAAFAVLMVVTSRPEFVPSWSKRHQVTEVALDRLGREVSAAMVADIAKERHTLSQDVLGRIVDRSDGNPLYIEELTREVLESDPASALGRGEPSVSVPDTLKSLLVARLDRASPVREVAQIGSVIGREFSQVLLEAVASMSNADLRRTLDSLVASNLLRRRTSPSGPVYVFKHALVQEAAYETLLHARRREFHRRIAEALETRFPETREAQPELLALHWEHSEVLPTAIKYWRLAGERAAGRSADFEADPHLSRALELAKRLPKGGERDLVELDLSVQHGGVLRVTRGPPAVETGMAFAHARELCVRTGDNALLVPALSGLYAYHFVRAENKQAAETAHELL